MTARGVQSLIAVAAVMGVAACGSVSAGNAGHPASASASASSSGVPAAAAGTSAGAAGTAGGGSLCADGQRADRVVVSRTASPRQVTLRGATQVQAMVAALCALPPMPRGLQQCPADFGGVSRLVFASGGREFQPVRIQLSGCRAVAGIGPTRSWSRSPRFGQLLTRTVGGKGRMIPGMHPSSVPAA